VWHRHLPALALAFAAGIGLFFLSHHWLPWPLFGAILLGLMLAGLRWRGFWLAALVLLGWGHAQLASAPLLQQPFPAALTRQDVWIQGTVIGLPDVTETGTRFLFRIRQAQHQGQAISLPRRVRLSWYQEAPRLQAGQGWRLQVRLKPPHGMINPGGFDYERWLFQQGIGATGYVRESADNRLVDAGGLSLDRLRGQLRARLIAVFGETQAGALTRALVLGDRGGFRNADWQVLARTGTSHLLAISGLHIGLIAGVALLLGRWLWARSEALTLWLAAPRAAALLGLVAALGYSALAGFAISTQRALIMLAVVMLAVLAGRVLRPLTGLSVALFAVLLLDPLTLLSFGFWLSFGAVAALLYALGARLGPPGWLARWGQAQWAVALGLLPLLVLLFGRVSLIAPLVNLIAVPLFALVLPVLLLAAGLALLSPWTQPLVWMGAGLELGFQALEGLAATPWASLALGQRPLWAWLAALLGVGLLLAPRGLPGRGLGVLYLLPLVLLKPTPPAPGTAAVTVLDVGQGLAVTVRTARHTLVYDLGPEYRSGFNTATVVVAPYLRFHGVNAVDRLILSHADRDHAGGLADFLRAMPVGDILSGEPQALNTAALRNHAVRPCRADHDWEWDGVDFSLLHPQEASLQGNDSSCVLKITTEAASLLLTGDISQTIEAQLIARDPEQLRARILVAGHHGSATSSSPAFLQAVAPRWVIYSAGFANRYGFPARSVRKRVDALGIPTLNTAMSGAIDFRLATQPPIEPPVQARQTNRWRWRAKPPPDQR
jgi:competence protein ComEC